MKKMRPIKIAPLTSIPMMRPGMKFWINMTNMPWKKNPTKKLIIPMARNVVGTTGTRPHPNPTWAIMPAMRSPTTRVSNSNARAPHFANKRELSRTGVASKIPCRLMVLSRHIISDPKKTMIMIMGKKSELNAIRAINRDVGKVVLTPIKVVTRRVIPNRARAMPTRIMKAVLRTVDKYSNLIRVQNALIAKPAPRLGVTALT